ncbi:hypothetical protein EJB05_31579 [Eragrostis curvula]|uniref:Peptidase C1A papain C-terminal domain-containing protein n=1 Tax=Eragrostis curvula TaxID=38414 RepID=A0A5J9UFK2_9POAL|nr:hypothetical protein EJB05_31579 [Eragrostis curvula]
MMGRIVHSAAAAVWKRTSLPSIHAAAAWKRMSLPSFHAAAAAWKGPRFPSVLADATASKHLSPRHHRHELDRDSLVGRYSIYRSLSTEHKKCCCNEPVPDSRIDGFMYNDCIPPESVDWCKRGAVEENVYPYVATQCPCQKIESHMVTIDGYQFVPPNDELALMKALANQPVVVDLCWTDVLSDYKGGIAYDEGERSYWDLNHSVLLVAYGATSKGEKFWTVKDSFGTKVRKKGFIHIARGVGYRGGAFGIARCACFPVKSSPNRHGFINEDMSLYSELYGEVCYFNKTFLMTALGFWPIA